MPTPNAPHRLPRRLTGLALPPLLLLSLVAALAACGSASSARSVSGTWGGIVTQPQMGTNSTITIADMYLQLQQAGDGKLTGKATLCHGVLGDHPLLGTPIQGDVTQPDQISLQFAPWAFHGTSTTTSALTLAGNFSDSGEAPDQTFAASLHPISADTFGAACTDTPTP